MDTTRLWIGTYPPDGPDGRPDQGEGVWAVTLDPVTGALAGRLAARAPAPSFLVVTADGRTVLAAAETSPGMVVRFEVTDDGGLVERERVSSGGSGPCHLLLHPAERAVYVANYGSGSVAVVPLRRGDDGALAFAGGVAQVFEHSGTGPRADRQEGPHAHATVVAPDGRHLLALDLGTDELRRYALHEDGSLAEAGVAARLVPGTGPRHAAVGPGGHLYVVGELTATLHVLAWDAASATAAEVQVLPVCTSPLASGEHVYPSHPVVVGDRVVVGVRGADVLAEFAVRDGGARLEHVRDVPVGPWPRHLAVLPGRAHPWVVAAVQHGGRVVALPWPEDGERPDAAAPDAGGRLAVAFPACVTPA